MTAEKLEFLTTLIKLIMMLVTIFIAPALRSWLKAHADEKTVRTMEQWADIAVKSAEQIRNAMNYTDPEGEKRKEWARTLITQAAEKMKIKITPYQIDMLIESAVIDNNDWWKSDVQKAEEG